MSISSVKVQTAPVPSRQNEVVSHMRCRIERGGGDRATVRASNAAEFVKLALEFLVPAASRETTGISVACDLGAYPGGLPRDRNTPRIETRRIPELQTLGNHEAQVPFRQALTAKHEIPGGQPRDWSELP